MRYAKDRFWISRKMNGLGFRSWPDRFFLPPSPQILVKLASKDRKFFKSATVERLRFWVEFKRRGETSTPDQVRVQKDLRARGERVYECDSFDSFVAIFEAHHYGTANPPDGIQTG